MATGENPYSANAFYVLKLPITASSREIRGRAHELRLEAQLSTDGGGELRDVQDAENVLLDAPRRLSEELFWICSPSEIVPPTISLDDGPAVQAAVDALRPLAQRGSILAWHDRAVLYHASAAMDTLPVVNVWKYALSCWNYVWRSDPYWTQMQERADNLADRRVGGTAVADLRQALPGRILRLSTEKVASLIDRGDDASAMEHLNVVEQAGFPTNEVDRVRREATEGLRLRVQGYLSEYRQELNRESESRPTQYSPNVRLGYLSNKLRGEVAVPVKRLKALDPTSEDVAKLADEAASHLRAISVRYHNEANDTDQAIVLLGEAEGLAVSAVLRQQFASDRSNLLSQSAFKKAAAFAETRQWEKAIAAANEAISLTASEDERRTIRTFVETCQRAKKRQTDHQWNSWSILVAILTVTVLYFLATTAAGPARGSTVIAASTPVSISAPVVTQVPTFALATPVSTFAPVVAQVPTFALVAPASTSPAVVSRGPAIATPTPNGVLATRSARLDQLGQQIDRERPVLEAQQTSLDGQAANIQALASQLQAIESQYPEGTAPTSVVDQYNALLSRHNSLVPDYNAALASFKSDSGKFNSEVDEYNLLLAQR